MKSSLYRFFARTDHARHETVIPADSYGEALEILGRNAAKTTGIAPELWWLKSVSPQR